jgi:hypothetical protein
MGGRQAKRKGNEQTREGVGLTSGNVPFEKTISKQVYSTIQVVPFQYHFSKVDVEGFEMD